MAERMVPRPLLGVLLAGCTSLTEPQSEERTEPSAATSSPAPGISARLDRGTTVENAKPERQPVRPGEQLGDISHILVSYAGAARSRATRSKEEALQRARELLERLRKGADFGALAAESSDDSTSRWNRGSLGVPAGPWVEPFARAAAALPPGGMSDLVETPFGFHIIKREK